MHILVACEESGVVCAAFRARGHLAWSVDLQPTSGPLPEYHIQGDVLEHLASAPDGHAWDMMIAFPSCQYLTVAGNRWNHDPRDKHLPEAERRPHPRFPDRKAHRLAAVAFVKRLWAADIPKVCIENPGRSRLSTMWRPPTQQIHPYHFGTPVQKKTGLWLRGLPELEHGTWVKPEMYTYKQKKNGVKKCESMWYFKTLSLPPAERTKARSKTFPCIANAMAAQWSLQI